MNNFYTELQKLEALPDERVYSAAEEVIRLWKKEKPLLRCLHLHSEIRELDGIMVSLTAVFRNSGRKEMNEKCAEGKNLIKDMIACEKFTFDNVL